MGSDAIFTPHRELNKLQTKIMLFMKKWANEEKTPIPHKQVLIYMEDKGIKRFTTVNALGALLIKGYIRRGYSEQANKTVYVIIRNI